MICLGIESTAHTFGVGIITDKGKVLANVKHTYTHEKEGIDPSLAKQHHLKHKDSIIAEALKKSKIKKEDIDLISVAAGPGLAPCLLVGMEAAKALASELSIPLVGVNHCVAHLEIGKLLTNATDPILLYASGANTQIIGHEQGAYRIFGETLDNGIGNFLDGYARHLGLGFPGGPKIEQLALQGNNLIELPYAVKGMDVSFGGLQTNLKQKFDSNKFRKEDLCFSLQETAFAMLVEVTERAMAHTGKQELVLGGGVACNKRLQDMCQKMCNDRGAQLFCPANEFLVDNGAMIAWLGVLAQDQATTDVSSLDILPRQRTEEYQF